MMGIRQAGEPHVGKHATRSGLAYPTITMFALAAMIAARSAASGWPAMGVSTAADAVRCK